jgi:hypothetical protein
MRITRSQIRALIKEQMELAGTLPTQHPGVKLLSKKIKTRQREIPVQMTPAQAPIWAAFPKGLGAGPGSGLSIEFSPGAWGDSGGDNAEVNEITWSKRGGYSDAIASKLMQSLTALGFKEKGNSNYNHPADTAFSSRTEYSDAEGNTVSWSSTYGVTKYDNSFTARLKFNPPLNVIGGKATIQGR